MDIKHAIDFVGRFGHLQMQEAEEVMMHIMSGETTDSQIGAYLMGLRMKGETRSEIVGSARAMRAQGTRVPVSAGGQLLDTCGTGGDKSGTFNISTAVAFVAAGAGVRVAKHGNRAATSKCGSADVLGALGANLDMTPEQVGHAIDEIGIGFMFAAKLHPAMKYAIGPRREMGIRTIFNILGPLTNPAGADCQLMGVFAPDLTDLLAHVLNELGSKSVFVVSGYGGLDELTTTGPNHISVLKDGEVKTYDLDATTLGFRGANISELLGGEPEQNAAIMRDVLSGKAQDAKRDTVLLNAAAALIAAQKANDFEEGIAMAAGSIDSGAALDKLDSLIAFGKQVAA